MRKQKPRVGRAIPTIAGPTPGRCPPADLQDAAIRQNVRDTAARLKVADGVLAEKIAEGRLKIVSATYDLSTAQVAFDA
ncbi:hypothetical protein PMI01_02011 [Caulobacter sp. AP07]|nr:hypothetical protein PMI01_02011 [Caulobacter sp. AP07]